MTGQWARHAHAGAGMLTVMAVAVGIDNFPVRDQPELRIIQPALMQPVEQGNEPQTAVTISRARLQHPPGLAQGLPPAGAVSQVIQRPEQQHRVLRLVRLG